MQSFLLILRTRTLVTLEFNKNIFLMNFKLVSLSSKCLNTSSEISILYRVGYQQQSTKIFVKMGYAVEKKVAIIELFQKRCRRVMATLLRLLNERHVQKHVHHDSRNSIKF